MERLVIEHADVIRGDRILADYTVICEESLIVGVMPSDTAPAAGGIKVDARGQYLAPGYIDLHTHGYGGKLVDHGREDLDAICRELPSHGVTGFLPTVCPVTGDEDALLEDLAKIQSKGTIPLGFFLEGHFLALTGAIKNMKSDHTPQRVERIRKALGSHNAVFGISPEIPGIASLLPLMTEGGLPAFITHTKASYEETERAIDAGARHATHFYDVFHYIGDKEGGVRGVGTVEAVMSRPEVSVDFILDGEHVHPGAVKMALACKGLDKVCLITDANLNAGCKPGVYSGIGGTEIIMEYSGGPAREYSGPGMKPGGLAGSGLTMDLAVKNAVALLGLPLENAVALASANPAKILGLERSLGKIEKGYMANFSFLDRDYSVTACYIAGKKCF
jgi:N-acetylglucosamine-6-phosphate deacetylase